MAKRWCIKSSDRISALPDELLISILSLLSLKEAAATSILCRDWRYLWTYTNKLDFDGFDFFRRVWSLSEHPEDFSKMGPKFSDHFCSVSGDLEESWNYISWVDNVFQSQKGSIEEFRIDFFLSHSHREYINKWLRFASEGNVQRLDLNLRYTSSQGYTLPYNRLMNFKGLRTMRMMWVNVSGEGLELLLRSCPLLEELSVTFSNYLKKLKIIGPSPLKRLMINSCQFLTSVEIRDSNLAYLMFHGELLEFVLKNVPHLVEMYIGGGILKHLDDFVLLFSSYLPQLEKLTFNSCWRHFLDMKAARMFYNNVKMSNLRQLTIKFQGWSNQKCNLMSLAHFVRASPLLQTLVIEAYGGEDKRGRKYFVDGLPQSLSEMYRYPHLKRVEFVGYRGSLTELELVVHFLENGAALEEVNIDLRKRDNPWVLFSNFWPNSVTGAFHVGYPISHEGGISALKARVMNLLKKMVPSKLDISLNIL